MDNFRPLDAKPREPMTRWNRRSDIQLTLNLFSRGVKYNPNATTDDLTFLFFTDGVRKYKCGRAGGVLHEIRINEDGSVTCFLDRPNFNPGRLHVEVLVTAANTDFKDENFRICKPSCLPILIVDGHSDDVDPNVSVALSLPYIEVTVWDALVGNGYLGTSEEFWRKFVGLMAGNSITADGAIRVVLASMGEDYDGEDIAHEQAPGECVYDGTRFQIAYMDEGGNVTYYSPSAELIYCNAVTNKLYRWNGAGWTLIEGGSTVIQNRYVANAAVVGNRLIISSSGSGGTSADVIANVNLLQEKIDELIGKLANSSFGVSPKPALVGELDWSSGDDEGGDTPTTYYNIIFSTSTMYTMSNAATRIAAGQPYTNIITANTGYHLTGITINGVAQDITDDGQFTIYIPSVTGNITIAITAEADEVQPVTTYNVGVTATDLDVDPDSGTVLEGGTFQCTLALASGVDGNEYRLPNLGEITINGTHGTATLSNGLLTIPNIQSDITIVAAAVAVSSVTHNVTYNLTDCTTNGATSVNDGDTLTAVITKSSSWGSTESFLARDIIVYMGGSVLVEGQNNDYTISQNGDNITVEVYNVTGDVEIVNVIFNNLFITGDDTNAAGTGKSKSTVTHIPIPSDCTQVKVWHNYVNTGGDSTYNILTYNSSKQKVRNINCTYVMIDNTLKDCSNTFNVASDEKFIRSSFYNFGADGNAHMTLADCYILDVTNNKYIWKGQNV